MFQPRVLAELRAGRVATEGGLARPDPRRGLLRVVADPETELVHLRWAERAAAAPAAPAAAAEPELDLVVFPGEAEFAALDRPGARIFTLRFPAEPARNLLFWAQDAGAGGDAARVAAVHAALNAGGGGGGAEPMEAEAPAVAAPPAAASSGAPSAPSAPPALAPAAPGAAAAAAAGIDASQLAAVLGSIMGGAPARGAAAAEQDAGPSLAEVLRAERVAPLLDDDALVSRLAPFLPEEHRTPAAMAAILHSPQFKAQLAQLSQALASGQLDASQFGLPGSTFGVADFLRSVQKKADEARGGEGKSAEGGDKPPEEGGA
jgi:26S proteasome regulatory subunit N13